MVHGYEPKGAQALLSELTWSPFGSRLAVNHVGGRVCHLPGNAWVAAQLAAIG